MRRVIVGLFVVVYAALPFFAQAESKIIEACNRETKQLCEYNLETNEFEKCTDIEC